ncbi:MAG: DUF5694 domain-containing protein [Bacteroidota bacterium]
MKTQVHLYLMLFLLSACLADDAVHEQDQDSSNTPHPIADPNVFIGAHQPQVMVLGVFHFHNPGLDDYQPKYPFDILEDQRQAELADLLQQLAAYRPTKILIEMNRIKVDSILNVRYREYLGGTFDIQKKTSEVFQIGFKLAEMLGHQRLYCSDATAAWFGAELDWDNYDEDAYQKSKGQYEKLNRYDFETYYAWHDSLKTTQTLTEHLIMLNDPTDRLKDHQAYLVSILEGAGDHYVGADDVGRWYRRNLRIFANAYDVTSFDQEDRLLLIYGAGHVWQLRQLFLDSPDFEYVEVNDYLLKTNS